MFSNIRNLVFEGGGILGIAYIGVLDYLISHNLTSRIQKVAGTSAGAITACITSFNLPFYETKEMADTLNFKKIPGKENHPDLSAMPKSLKINFEKRFGDIDCLYRLINDYGWFSSRYLYDWISRQIADQFDPSKKRPPYTFADFKNPSIHIEGRPFLDLYIIGTNISYRTSQVFSFETTPNMEVAKAVRISMSIPLFFEAVKVNVGMVSGNSSLNVFADGSIRRNYPINLFDYNFQGASTNGVNYNTLGVRFKSNLKYNEINNLLDYIENLFLCLTKVQQDIYDHSPQDIARSIQIEIENVSPVNFDISLNDETYLYLYRQGYKAAKSFFENRIN